MAHLSVSPDAEGAWPELADKTILHVQSFAIGGLAGGMASGKPSVSIKFDLPNGQVVFAETSLALMDTAVAAIHARHFVPQTDWSDPEKRKRIAELAVHDLHRWASIPPGKTYELEGLLGAYRLALDTVLLLRAKCEAAGERLGGAGVRTIPPEERRPRPIPGAQQGGPGPALPPVPPDAIPWPEAISARARPLLARWFSSLTVTPLDCQPGEEDLVGCEAVPFEGTGADADLLASAAATINELAEADLLVGVRQPLTRFTLRGESGISMRLVLRPHAPAVVRQRLTSRPSLIEKRTVVSQPGAAVETTVLTLSPEAKAGLTVPAGALDGHQPKLCLKTSPGTVKPCQRLDGHSGTGMAASMAGNGQGCTSDPERARELDRRDFRAGK